MSLGPKHRFRAINQKTNLCRLTPSVFLAVEARGLKALQTLRLLGEKSHGIEASQ